MRERLQPIEFSDLSAGLDKYSNSTLLANNRLSESENIRHDGPGRIRRRWGSKKFSTTLQSVTPHTRGYFESDSVSSFLIPYLRETRNQVNRRIIVDAIYNIRHLVYGNVQGAAQAKILLVDKATNTHLSYGNVLGQRPEERKFGFGFLDGKSYVGGNIPLSTINDDLCYPLGIRIIVTPATTPFTIGKILTGQTSGAVATVKFAAIVESGPAYQYILSNWNGIDFEDGETIKDNTPMPSTVSGTLYAGSFYEHGHSGVIVEQKSVADTVDSLATNWQARKWGIRAPSTKITATPTATEEHVFVTAGDYDIKYTFIRYIGGSLSGSSNPKLSGGEFISESAPSEITQVTVSIPSYIDYTAWEATLDPQVTHIRIYRSERNTQVYHHVCDVAIGGSSVHDFLPVTDLQLEMVILDTDGYTPFGQDGENCGHIIEVANHRVYVSGNSSYPTRVYMSRPLQEHRHSEYFYSSLDITESPGQTNTALKWWNGTLYVFQEDSVFKIIDAITNEGGTIEGFKRITKGKGCVADNGVLDMGSYLLVMTAEGLCQYDGVNFGNPLTLGVNSILGSDLRNAIMVKGREYVYIITETSRTNNSIITIKYSDGTFALGIDKINSAISIPDRIGYVPNLVNYDNGQDNGDAILFTEKVVLGTAPNQVLYYCLDLYDLNGQNYDLQHTVSDGTTVNKIITAKFSPKYLDFGSFSECQFEEIMAYVRYLGLTDSDYKAPTGEFLVRFWLNLADDDTAESYGELLLRPDFKRNLKVTTQGDPIQTKYTMKSGDVSVQTGGVFGNDNPANLVADIQQVIFRQGVPTRLIGRIWKILFEYKSKNNFEFTNFAAKFVREDEP